MLVPRVERCRNSIALCTIESSPNDKDFTVYIPYKKNITLGSRWATKTSWGLRPTRKLDCIKLNREETTSTTDSQCPPMQLSFRLVTSDGAHRVKIPCRSVSWRLLQ